jgi:hypothetical protein
VALDPAVEALALELCRQGALPTASDAALPVSDRTLQDLVALVVRAYARRLEANEGEEALPPFRADAALTATEVVVLVTEMLRAADIEVFELGMWQAFGRV